MIQIEDKIVSRDILEVQFVCDYEACRGICCVEGDSGAPLEHTETMTMRRLLPLVEPLLSADALEVIHSKGISYIPRETKLPSSSMGEIVSLQPTTRRGVAFVPLRRFIEKARAPFPSLSAAISTLYGYTNTSILQRLITTVGRFAARHVPSAKS